MPFHFWFQKLLLHRVGLEHSSVFRPDLSAGEQSRYLREVARLYFVLLRQEQDRIRTRDGTFLKELYKTLKLP